LQEIDTERFGMRTGVSDTAESLAGNYRNTALPFCLFLLA